MVKKKILKIYTGNTNKMEYNYIKKNILSINEDSFTSTYEVLKNFIIPNNDGWNIVFYKGNKIQISYNNQQISFLNQNTKNWEKKDLNYQNFMDPQNLNKFKLNAKKITG